MPVDERVPSLLIRWLLWDWLELETLLERPRYAEHDRASIDAVLDMAAEFSASELAPFARTMDAAIPTFDASGAVHVHPASVQAVCSFAENGFFATVFDEARGGLQLPNVVHATLLGLNMAGCVATASYILLTVGNARLIVEKGTPAQIKAFADPQIAGVAMGTMCLSEPHAGSALGAITTCATPDGEDELGCRFRVRGSKMWISGADQDITDNIIHLVLAKAPDETGRVVDGARGISLFIVPKFLPDGTRNDITVVGLNHKLGQRALPNCALTFGDGQFQPKGSAGAIGWLVGEVGQGLAYMFQMMNDARVAVGMSGAILALRGYRLSLAYARERVQGAVGGQPATIIQHPDVKRMLLAQKSISEGALALVLFGAKLLDDEQSTPDEVDREHAAALLRLLTPAIKSWPAEFGQESLHNAIQVLGGAGYTTDHEVEKLYRDNRLNPIHEGTTGIQGIDFVNRKLRRNNGADFALLRDRMRSTLETARATPETATVAESIAAAVDRLDAAVRLAIAEDNEERLLSVATPLLFAFGHVVVTWLWLDQVLATLEGPAAADAAQAAFHAGRRRAMEFFVQFELPRIHQWLNALEQHSNLVASMAADQF